MTDSKIAMMKDECLKNLDECLVENKRKNLLNYVFIVNVVMKLCVGVFVWRLCWLNLYCTVIGVAVIVIINFIVTINFYIYHKKFQNADSLVKFSGLFTVCLLSFMTVKHDRQNFSTRVNRMFIYKLQLLWHYLLYLPISSIVIYEFIRVFYLKTIIIIITSAALKVDNVSIANTFVSTLYATSFDYYFYLILFMSSSFFTILNAILLNKQISDETHEVNDELALNRQLFNENNWICNRHLNINVLFSFLFRYFFYLSRNLSLVLTLISTIAVVKLSSDKAGSVTFSQNYYFYILVAYLLVTFTVYVLIHFMEELSVNDQHHRFQPIIESIYHAYVMMVDIDEHFFKQVVRKFRFYTKIKIGIFMISVLASVTLCSAYWYYWYYSSYNYTLLDNDSMLLILLNSFTKFKYQLLTSFNYEQQIQDEIRFKQIMLVVICGCTLVSILSFHIYYNYYFNYNFIDVSKLEMFSEVKLSSAFYYKQAKSTNQSHDDFYTSTTEISESTKCSSCYTVTNSASSSAISSDFEDASTFPKHPQQTKTPRITNKYDYDSSSGVLSSVTSSSNFSSSYEKQIVDNLVDTITTITTATSNPANPSITQINLIMHNNQSESDESQQASFYDKVYTWFTKTQQSEFPTSIQQDRKPFRDSLISQQTTSDCSMII